jgi:hypothetical protein
MPAFIVSRRIGLFFLLRDLCGSATATKKQISVAFGVDLSEDLPNLLTNARAALNTRYPDYHENKVARASPHRGGSWEGRPGTGSAGMGSCPWRILMRRGKG